MNAIHPAVIEAIESVIENSEHPIYEKIYSGRGMYGVNCYGITCNRPLEVISMITHEVWDTDDEEVMVCWIFMMRVAQIDNMGKQQILYFPGYEAV